MNDTIVEGYSIQKILEDVLAMELICSMRIMERNDSSLLLDDMF